jgi:hypothetical protein
MGCGNSLDTYRVQCYVRVVPDRNRKVRLSQESRGHVVQRRKKKEKGVGIITTVYNRTEQYSQQLAEAAFYIMQLK